MTERLSIVSSGMERSAFKISIEVSDTSTADLYVTQDYAEIEALKLSKLLPDKFVRLEKFSRCKAVYRNGARVVVNDYNTFYDKLTPEEYKSTLVLCTTTHEWV